MRRVVLTFGLISGALLSALMFVSMLFHDQIGFDRGLIVGYSTMVAAFLLIYFGVRSYRDNVAGGTVTFGKAFQVGFLIMLVSSTCYVASWQVVYRTVASDYTDKYAAYALEKERREGATEAQIEERRQEMARFAELYRNPLVNIAFTYLEPLPVGLAFALLTAAILSRRRKEIVTA